MRPAQQEEEAGLAQGKLRRQLRTGRALLALGLSGLRRQQSGTGYCEMLNDRLQFSWCSMCRCQTGHGALCCRRRQAPLVRATHPKVRCGGCESRMPMMIVCSCWAPIESHVCLTCSHWQSANFLNFPPLRREFGSTVHSLALNNSVIVCEALTESRMFSQSTSTLMQCLYLQSFLFT